MLTLKHVLNALSQPLAEAADFPITGGSIDSRLTRKNDLFVALAGENTDGHQFVDQAFQNGACLALVEKTPQSAYPVVDLAQSQVQNAAPVGPALAVPLAEADEQAVVPVDGQQVAVALADVPAQQELPDVE